MTTLLDVLRANLLAREFWTQPAAPYAAIRTPRRKNRVTAPIIAVIANHHRSQPIHPSFATTTPAVPLNPSSTIDQKSESRLRDLPRSLPDPFYHFSTFF